MGIQRTTGGAGYRPFAALGLLALFVFTLLVTPATAETEMAPGGTESDPAVAEITEETVPENAGLARQSNTPPTTVRSTTRDIGAITDSYQRVAIWALPVLVLIIIGWATFRHVNRTKGLKAGGVGRLNGPGGRPVATKTATQLRAADIHRDEYKNPYDDIFDADEPENEAWIVGHDGQTLDFDWNEDIGFHDRRVERREKHPKDPRPDKPPTPAPIEGQRLDDAMLVPSHLAEPLPRPYIDAAGDQPDDGETPPST